MIVAIGCDHAGTDVEDSAPDMACYRDQLVEYLNRRGQEVLDLSPNHKNAVDYPNYAQAVCNSILDGSADRGVIVCGTGIGMSMAANRNPGIRAAVCWSPKVAELSRQHNNANVLCLGRRVLTIDECFAIADVWFSTEFSTEDRHHRRVDKMDRLGGETAPGEPGGNHD
jgi:ribose 5-phosphate isomerase B